MAATPFVEPPHPPDAEATLLTGVTFNALPELSLQGTIMRDCDLSNVRARGGRIRRAECHRCRLVGFDLSEGAAHDLRLVGGSAMLASFSFAGLRRVVFDEVDLSEASFMQARLEAVQFIDCRLAGADFRGARLRDCVMRGSSLEGVVGVDSLSGLRMPWPDIVASVGALAEALGLSVEETDG